MSAYLAENDILDAVLDNVRTELVSSGICTELSTLWTELWDAGERENRREILAKECGKEISDMVQSVLHKETNTKDNYITRIEKLLKEMEELQSNLAMTIPYEDVSNLPLHNMAYNLNKKAEKYRVIRDERLSKFSELQQKEVQLCQVLGTVPTASINCSNIPTETELEQLAKTIDAMDRERVDRMFTFLEKRKLICELYRELGLQPALKFDKEVVSETSVDSFEVTNENMAKLDELVTNLSEQMEDAKQTVQDLREKLTVIWNYLDEPESYSAVFLSNHCGHTATVMKAMKEELSRCEAAKRANIAKIVAKIREILVEEWNKCMISEEERNKFRAFRIDCFTEDLCELHEMEIERLKNFYRDNQHIFDLYAKHQRLFHKLLDLQSRSKNVKRYQNRGGQLLQEERERRMITKELPVVEEELRLLLNSYQAEHGAPFTSYGKPLCQTLDDQWADHFDQKITDKLIRKLGSEKKGMNTALGKRLCPTPGSTSVASKVSRLNCDKVTSTNTGSSHPSTPVARRRLLMKSKSDEPELTFTVEPTYDDFQIQLQAKVDSTDGCKKPVTRSTAIVQPTTRVLRERNTPTIQAPSTPVKPRTPGPNWTSMAKTPLTFPRRTRSKGILQRSPSAAVLCRLTPARSRLPIII